MHQINLSQSVLGLAQRGIPKKVVIGHFNQIGNALKAHPNETYEELGQIFQKLSLPEFVAVNKNIKSIPFFIIKSLALGVSASKKIKQTTSLEKMLENKKRWNKDYPVLMRFLSNILVPKRYTIEIMKIDILMKQEAKAVVVK